MPNDARPSTEARPTFDYLIVVADPDPVASAVAGEWGTPPTTGSRVGDAPIRQLSEHAGLVRRAELHIQDDLLGAQLPPELRSAHLPLVFPSVHRSESGTPTVTVHPLGNPGPTADVGGRPRSLVATAPRLQTHTLRRIAEVGPAQGFGATFEATHHGPYLENPAFFVEIGIRDEEPPPDALVKAYARILPDLHEDPTDRIALGVGGGHYAPRFTDLALRRRWAFGHILSRHGLAMMTEATAHEAVRRTPGAEGILFHRVEDERTALFRSIGPHLRETDAELRNGAGDRISRSSSSPPSGT
ncbi:MAG: D-aminoacyl-tRNA deacylase [Thermoplasmata archaeon]